MSSTQIQQASEYPRPDFVSLPLHWESLNGPWDLYFDDADSGLTQGLHFTGLSSLDNPQKRTIQVPFVFQCPASGINEQTVHEVLWYERQIHDLRDPAERESGHKLLVRFGAIDYHATIWLDGHYVGEHRGGQTPFDLDLSDAVFLSSSKDSYRLTVRVFDSATDLTQPRGKQYWGPKPESIFYTPSSGIWQNVWLESVPRYRIADSSHGTIMLSNDIGKGALDAKIAVLGRRVKENVAIELEVSLGGVLVSKSDHESLPDNEDFVRFDLDMRLSEAVVRRLPPELRHEIPPDDPTCWHDRVALWSPNHPTLYEIVIRLYNTESDTVVDEVHTTTGMRALSWTKGDNTFRLNGAPLFQSLFLDQGYWQNTLMTPPSQEALKQDIILSKAMGFNGCRKHQKVEDPAFMYWADRLGFLVWGEMANEFGFSVLGCERFEQEWMESVRRDINHPCIVTWTPVNESWGYDNLDGDARQRDHIRSLYYQTKMLDPTRPVNDNCGWEHVVTDLSTFHEYQDAPGMANRCKDMHSILATGRAMFLGPIYGSDGPARRWLAAQFGGVNVAVKNDDSRQGNWGYTTAADSKDLLERFDKLMVATVEAGHVCGIVWTQFSDIEQEANGLYTYDRKPKIDPEGARRVVERVERMYHEKLKHGR
ncbi:hypothetical protein LTR78_001588 [Recurvomyces mirabilis]|uniref:Glycoside hydrolase family 2 protein n=1 Tax=Recurvomyces mirabilis TaxID=574656 RepID=A0AAE0WUW4_9PEZI|nr:hypothetical protein LTR78_001588 [Recurvomyces mirabilis]KAK5151840.1 hypothetical protein LTS14_008974 [Recurvomyces mirabilis]